VKEEKKKNSSRPLPRGRSSRRAKAGERKEKELNHRSRRSSQIRKENCPIFFNQRKSARSAEKFFGTKRGALNFDLQSNTRPEKAGLPDKSCLRPNPPTFSFRLPFPQKPASLRPFIIFGIYFAC
jgi:hypothetical protein